MQEPYTAPGNRGQETVQLGDAVEKRLAPSTQPAIFGDVVERFLPPPQPAIIVPNVVARSAKVPEQPTTFEDFARLGYGRRLVPIIPPDAKISERSSLTKRKDALGKVPGVRGHDGLWSGFDWLQHIADERDHARWQAMGAGIGIKTGRLDDGDSLVLIDADTLDLEQAKLIRDAIWQTLCPLGARIGQAPKCGYPVRVRGEFRYSRVEFGELDVNGRLTSRVEILSEGRQFVAAGVHPTTGKPYSWPRPLPAYDDLPIIEPAALRAFLSHLSGILPAARPIVTEGSTTTVSQESLRGKPDDVRRAVEAIPNTSQHFGTRESYRDMGYAIKAALPNDEPLAFELFNEWCARWQDGHNDPEIVEADWRRMKPPFRRGAGWIYELAELHAPERFNRAEQWFEQPADGSIFGVADQSSAAAPVRALEFVPFCEAARTAVESSAKPLIKGLLDQGTLSVVYGESNVGKTFVAMDIARAVAMGAAFGGLRAVKTGVLYIAAEGGAGARKRCAALLHRYPDMKDARFSLLMKNVNLLRADADLRPIIEAVRQQAEPIGLVVVDTLSRVMAGGDENASTDMGALVRHFDALRQATGAHVMVVHHSGKDVSRGARGHSLLRAATDTEIEIAEGRIVVTKQRDIDGTFNRAFKLNPVELGRDADGDPITSCTIALTTACATSAGPLPEKRRRVYEAALAFVKENNAHEGMRPEDIAGVLHLTSEQVRGHFRELLKSGHVTKNTGRWFVLPPAVVEHFEPPPLEGF